MRLNFQKKFTAIALAFLLCVQLIPGIYASAAAIDKDTAFEYRISKAEGEAAPGNILVQLYVETDPSALITTAGATLIINTDYVDVVNKKGTPITDTYKQDVVQFGKNFPITAEPIGEDNESFASIKGLSLASYNAKSKDLYLFVCGMAIAGLTVPQKSLMASYYLQAKGNAKLPASAIRLASKAELQNSCPSKAVYVTQISSKKEVGTAPSALTMSADESVIEKSKQPDPETTAPETTAPETTTEKAAPETTTASDETTQVPSDTQSTTAVPDEQQTTTKKVSDMTEQEVEEELEQKIELSKSLKLNDTQKKSDVYKAYDKAVKEAQEVLENKKATPQQKQQALEKLRDAEKALEKAFPEVAKQLQVAQTPKTGIWLYIGIGAVVIAVAAIIAVIIIKKKKSTAK